MRILVVDDEPSIRLILRQTLTKGGHDVDVASDGLEGLAKLSSSRYDLLITDVNMPRLNGLELLDKALTLDSQLLVCVMTSESSFETIRQVFEKRAHGFLFKPFSNLATVRTKIEKLTRTVRRSEDRGVRIQ